MVLPVVPRTRDILAVECPLAERTAGVRAAAVDDTERTVVMGDGEPQAPDRDG
jgi:hypothetical protein